MPRQLRDDGLLEDPSTKHAYGALYDAYRAEHVSFEAVSLLRRSAGESDVKRGMQAFSAHSTMIRSSLLSIKEFFLKNKIIIDPHTAVGVAAEEKCKAKSKPMIYVSTAHPAKFPGTIYKAVKKKITLPNKYKSLLKSKENYKIIDLNYNKIKNYLIQKSKFVKNV